MARKITTNIEGTQCIGDSLNVINTNFENLDTSVVSLSTSVVSLSSLRFGTRFTSTTVTGTQSTVTLVGLNGNILGYIPVYSAKTP
jgi:hypothetical protein